MVSLVDSIMNGVLSFPKELEAYFRKDTICRKVHFIWRGNLNVLTSEIILFYGLKKLCSSQPDDYFVILELTALIQNASKLEEEVIW
jgi:hypothetical protein